MLFCVRIGLMIPQEKNAAVYRALREAFDASDFDEIHDMTGRGANPVFRIVVRGTPYLLRINLRAGDVARHYTCMKLAAEAGLAPRVWYTSVEDRLAITDFIKAVPFPRKEAMVKMPATLRTLHALPRFGEVPHHLNTSCMFLMNKGPALDGFLERVQSANIAPKSESDEFFARFAQLAASYPHDPAQMVSSHNDLYKPDNILFDGDRVWLVDWEAAFLNDRYADLAVVANLLVNDDAEQAIYLREYFGEAPDEYQLARFYLAQQIAHAFYAMGFLLFGSAGAPIDWTESAPAYLEFHRRFWAGEVDMRDKAMMIAYGRVHWERFLADTGESRFDEALRIVADRHRHPAAAVQ